MCESEEQDHDQSRHQRLYTELATLAGGLAHEIRNPLSTISLNLELMVEELEPESSAKDRRQHNRIEKVQAECQHLEEILNAFLQFARVGKLACIPCDFNELIRTFLDFYKPQAAEDKIEISPHLDPDLPPVEMDSALMRQVIMNLVQNAQQAMPDGGLLELQTRKNENRVFLDIIDNGKGMNEKTTKKMFDVFFSTKTSGSGLGLPTVKKIIEAHGGTIVCDSEPMRGTRFTISLPVEQKTDE